jgi:hypothetical protein
MCLTAVPCVRPATEGPHIVYHEIFVAGPGAVYVLSQDRRHDRRDRGNYGKATTSQVECGDSHIAVLRAGKMRNG